METTSSNISINKSGNRINENNSIYSNEKKEYEYQLIKDNCEYIMQIKIEEKKKKKEKILKKRLK